MAQAGFFHHRRSRFAYALLIGALLATTLFPLRLFADELSQARSLEGEGKPAAAAAAYERWLDANRDSPEWGAILFRTADILPSPYQERALLEQWLPRVRQGSTRHGMLVRLARLSELLGRLDQAQIYFEEAASVPGQQDLRSLLASATILLEMGEGEKAATQCHELLQLSDDPSLTVETRILLARLDVAEGRSARASETLRELLRPPVAELLGPQGLLEMWRIASAGGMGALEKAIASSLTTRYPDSPEAALTKDRVATYPTPFTLLGESAGEAASRALGPPSDAPASGSDGGGGTAPAAAAPQTVPQAPASSAEAQPPAGAATAIQVGSYLDRENAAYRLKEVADSGFHGEIRTADIGGKRYYRVLVTDVPAGEGPSVLAKLRASGLDGFLTRD